MTLKSACQETYPEFFALVYQVIGSVGEAEDAVQDAWIRLLNQPKDTVESLTHLLYGAVSNLGINALRSAKRTTTGYHGQWLLEPLQVYPYFRSPETEALLREDLSIALLLMLDTSRQYNAPWRCCEKH